MVDDDDGVGLGTDGPLISLKTHEDSRAEGGGRGGTAKGWKPAPTSLSEALFASWGPKDRANHHMSYVYAYSCTPVMHVYENMLRSSWTDAHSKRHAPPSSPLLLCSKHVIHDRDTTISHVLPVGSNIYPFYLEHRRKTILGLR